MNSCFSASIHVLSANILGFSLGVSNVNIPISQFKMLNLQIYTPLFHSIRYHRPCDGKWKRGKGREKRRIVKGRPRPGPMARVLETPWSTATNCTPLRVCPRIADASNNVRTASRLDASRFMMWECGRPVLRNWLWASASASLTHLFRNV